MSRVHLSFARIRKPGPTGYISALVVNVKYESSATSDCWTDHWPRYFATKLKSQDYCFWDSPVSIYKRDTWIINYLAVSRCSSIDIASVLRCIASSSFGLTINKQSFSNTSKLKILYCWLNCIILRIVYIFSMHFNFFFYIYLCNVVIILLLLLLIKVLNSTIYLLLLYLLYFTIHIILETIFL